MHTNTYARTYTCHTYIHVNVNVHRSGHVSVYTHQHKTVFYLQNRTKTRCGYACLSDVVTNKYVYCVRRFVCCIVCIYTCVYTHVYVLHCTYIHMCLYTRICTALFAYTHVFIHTYMYCTVRIYTCVYTHVYAMYTHVFIHTYMSTRIHAHVTHTYKQEGGPYGFIFFE